MRCSFVSIALALFVFGSAQSSKTQADRLLTAPTYYLVARTQGCTQQEMRVVGATNVPPGAVILVNVTEFFQDGWKDFSANYYATVDEKGFFEANVKAMANISFRRNLVARVVFGPAYHQQPAGVLTIVGRRGERLGSNNNPQLGQLSGENFYIETIARVEGCPSEGR
jgi:hypothetical protein